MAKATKGPLPVNPLADMIKEALRRREAAKMAKITKGQGVEMSELDKVIESKKPYGVQNLLVKGSFDEAQSRLREKDRPASEDTRKKFIKEGFFTEKDGSIFPTEKYNEYKRAGKLSSVGLK